MVSELRVGAIAYLVKVATCETFIKSLELVMLGVTLLPPEILTFISDRQDRSRNGRAGGHNGHAVDDEDGADDRHADDDDDDGDDEDDGNDGEMVGAEVGTSEHVLQAKSSYTPALSARQQSILGCLIHGDSNKTIARNMHISEATVKGHGKTILRRTLDLHP